MSQRTLIQSCCKNHQHQIGLYFIADQPWAKFCSECALSMALFGKKIDKDLSAEELGNKAQIINIAEKMKRFLQKIEEGKAPLNSFIQKIQNIAKSEVIELVRSFDQYVNKLCEVRNEMLQIFESSFTHSSQAYFERQTKIFLSQMQLQKSLEYIETYFQNLVQNKDQTVFSQKMAEWNNLLDKVQKLVPKETQQIELEQFINERVGQIKDKLVKIQPFQIDSHQVKNRFITEVKHEKTQPRKTADTSICLDQSKENTRRTQLKLRSKSKKTEKKQEKNSSNLKIRKVMRDVTNFQTMETFQI